MCIWNEINSCYSLHFDVWRILLSSRQICFQSYNLDFEVYKVMNDMKQQPNERLKTQQSFDKSLGRFKSIWSPEYRFQNKEKIDGTTVYSAIQISKYEYSFEIK